MTPKERAAMQQALGALEVLGYGESYAAIDLREALDHFRDATKKVAEQAEQEPVAWFVQYKNRHEFVFGSKPEFIVDGVVEPLYAAPVRTKDLTDDEILVIANLWEDEVDELDFARAVIAADREKNK